MYIIYIWYILRFKKKNRVDHVRSKTYRLVEQVLYTKSMS